MAGEEADHDDLEDNEVLKERSYNLAKKKVTREKLLDLYKDIEKGYEDQYARANDISDYWDIVNAELGPQQYYSGNSKIFVPIVQNAVNARKTRFTNQIFPQSGRYIECTTEDGTMPFATMALAEHYVRKARLRLLMPALMRNGDTEGQYTVYASWSTGKRHVVHRVKKPVKDKDGEDGVQQIGEDGKPEEEDDIEEETIATAHPVVEVIADSDLCVLPATAASIEEAIESGGSVTILRRWSKAKIRQMIDDGEIEKREGEALIEEMQIEGSRTQTPDKSKEMAAAAGIKSVGGGKHALVFETWSKVKVADEGWRKCRTFFGGPDRVLSCKRNPNWSDKVPVFSTPVEAVQGSFKGISKVKAVQQLQYFANDSINEAADSAAFGMLPIIMTDPQSNPRVGSMVLSLAAVWEVDPNSTKFAQFPELWKNGLEMVAATKQEIFQTLGVNPSFITQGSKKKQSQAEVAQEQQVDLLATADAVTVIEEGILTPLVSFFIDMDHQFRNKPLLVRKYGEMGMRAEMEEIAPIAMDHLYQFRWFGVEAARSAQQTQQMIAGLNVLKGIPPQMYQGYRLNLVPAIVQFVENTFGPRLAPLVFEDMRSQLSVDPKAENELLNEGMQLPVHPMDNHQEHMKVHIAELKERGEDPQGVYRVHLLLHQQALAQAAQAQVQAMQPQGQPGSPGGAGQPGAAGAPRAGAMPMPPRGSQGPPGMIHRDQMRDPRAMPRRMG